jgi:hypothetical protein
MRVHQVSTQDLGEQFRIAVHVGGGEAWAAGEHQRGCAVSYHVVTCRPATRQLNDLCHGSPRGSVPLYWQPASLPSKLAASASALTPGQGGGGDGCRGW